MRVVLLLRTLGYVRLVDPVIDGLLERGHSVHLIYEREIATPREEAWLARQSERPGFSSSLTDALRRDRWFRAGTQLRRIGDYLWYLGPEFRHVPSLVAKARHRVDPRHRVGVRRLGVSSDRVRRLALRAVRAVEDALPPSTTAAAELRALGADVLVLVPHLMPGNRHSEYVRAARTLAVPTCMCIASWDNLTTKQELREIPDRLVVWNDVQVQEAVDLHGMPRDRIRVTGAPSFDGWFERRPRPRDAFCARVGLDPARPYLAYLGGALFAAELTEAEFVRDRWIPALRADERFRGVGILVRPHPRRLEEWDAEQFDSLPDVVVWPRAGAAMPVDEESRADFFDTLHHSAGVAGVNTTAMIEAAVAGRPVHTLLVPAFAESQETVHFRYLLELGGGLLEVAEGWPEHLDALARSLAGDDGGRERRERFLERFVRPAGLDRPALPLVLDAIESTALCSPPREGTGRRVLRAALQAAAAVVIRLRRRA